MDSYCNVIKNHLRRGTGLVASLTMSKIFRSRYLRYVDSGGHPLRPDLRRRCVAMYAVVRHSIL